MASRVVMPKLSDTMEEGKILRWLRKEGDRIETGQTLAEVETDKATVEMEAYTTGVIRRLIARDGQTVRIGELIAVIGEPDEDISALVDQAAVPASRPAPGGAPAGAAAGVPASVRPAPMTASSETAQVAPGVKASPLAFKMAADAGLTLSGVVGTGPQGRIVKRDIEAALAHGAAPAEPSVPVVSPRATGSVPTGETPADVEDVELSTIRRTIARRLIQSKGPIPHFYLTVDVAVDRLWHDYQALKAQQSPVTINDIIIKATASALRRHPALNASFAGDHLKQYGRVHIAVAVALDDGLITPVVRDADRKSIEEISIEARALIERARAKRLQPDEYTGATFSISNLGMMGIEEFSAIINPPEAAILAVGAMRETPVVDGGQVRTGRRMKLTLSVDHRVADGAMAARFLQTLVTLFENPLLLG